VLDNKIQLIAALLVYTISHLYIRQAYEGMYEHNTFLLNLMDLGVCQSRVGRTVSIVCNTDNIKT